MYPLDGSSPDEFSGVDFATYVCAAQIYDERKVEDQVAKVVEDFFETQGVPTRRCVIGGLGAAAGGPWIEVYLWVKENLEFMHTIVSLAIGWAIGASTKWKNFRKRLDNKVLDRYVPSIVLEIGARTKGMDQSSPRESLRSFNNLLRLVPALDETLRSQLPHQNFSLCVVNLSENDAPRLALFQAERIMDADVARVLRDFRKKEHDPDSYAVLLHREFGFFTRLRRGRGASGYMSLLMGTNP